MRQKSYRKAVVYFIICIFVVLTLMFLQRLVMPKYMSDVTEGAMIAEYYAEQKNHDVIFIGDCEIYDTFVPAILWEKFGIHSYVRGSAQQLIWQSYYLLEDTLRYETPDVVVFNVLSLKYNTPQKESYNRMTLDGMRFSGTKLKAVKASMLKEEHMIEYIFPLLRYHSRITDLSKEDVVYLFKKDKVTHNGYYMRVDSMPATELPEVRPLGEYAFGEKALSYLDQIVALCKENGITLVLVKAPSLYPHWYDPWEQQIEEYASLHELPYINFLELTKECGIDYSQDTYDAGMHLNLYGAEKVTMWFGEFLQQELGLPDRHDETALSEIWEIKLQNFYRDKEIKTKQWLNN